MEEGMLYLVGTPVIDRTLYPEFEPSEELMESHMRNELKKKLFPLEQRFEPLPDQKSIPMLRKFSVANGFADFEVMTGFSVSPTSPTASMSEISNSPPDLFPVNLAPFQEINDELNSDDTYEDIYIRRSEEGGQSPSRFHMTNPLYAMRIVEEEFSPKTCIQRTYVPSSPSALQDDYCGISVGMKRFVLSMLVALIVVLLVVPPNNRLSQLTRQNIDKSESISSKKDTMDNIFRILQHQRDRNLQNGKNVKSSIVRKEPKPFVIVKNALQKSKQALENIISIIPNPITSTIKVINRFIKQYFLTTLGLLLASETAIVVGGGWFLVLLSATAVGIREVNNHNQ